MTGFQRRWELEVESEMTPAIAHALILAAAATMTKLGFSEMSPKHIEATVWEEDADTFFAALGPGWKTPRRGRVVL